MSGVLTPRNRGLVLRSSYECLRTSGKMRLGLANVMPLNVP